MAIKPVQKFNDTGAAPSLTAASAGGDSFPLISRSQKFHFKNGHATLARTITFVAQRSCSLGVLHNKTLSVPALSERIVQGFGEEFRDNNGRMQLTYSSEADITLGSYQ